MERRSPCHEANIAGFSLKALGFSARSESRRQGGKAESDLPRADASGILSESGLEQAKPDMPRGGRSRPAVAPRRLAGEACESGSWGLILGGLSLR